MTAELDLPLLRAFIACVRLGSISKAAALSGRTQPAISQQLRRLEDIVGEPLLRRTPSGVTVTATGEEFLPYAERIIALSADALAGSGARRRLSGRCGIGLLEDLTTKSLVRGLADFGSRHPDARLELVTLPGPAMCDAFEEGRIQLMLGDASYVERQPVWTSQQPLVWVSMPNFDEGDEPVPIILFSQPCRWREGVLRALDSAGVAWRVAFESTSIAGVLAGVRAGLGVAALLPTTVPSDLEEANRSTRRPALPSVEISLVRAADCSASRLVNAIERLLKQLV